MGSFPRSPLEALAASPAVVEGVMAAMGDLPRLPPRRTARLPLLTPRTPAPFLLPRHHHTAVDKRHPATTSPQGLEGLRQEEEKEERHELCQEGLQPQGM